MILTISHSNDRIGKYPKITYSKHSKTLTINKNPNKKNPDKKNPDKKSNKTLIQIVLSNNSIPKQIKIINESLLGKYLSLKTDAIYALPDNRIRVMKGKFFYDHVTSRYAVDPKDWWVSEKLDGIRAIWTGCELRTRHDKKIHAPDWFIEKLPKNIALDGELYLGRGQFSKTQMIVMDHHKNRYNWEQIKYHVFDIPDSKEMIFEEVQYILNNNLPDLSYLTVIQQSKISSLDQLLELQKSLVIQDAEGTMIRRPNSIYTIGETSNLLKFKSQMDDNQMVHLLDDNAIITGYKYNLDILNSNGAPIIRALLVKWVDTKKFPYDPEFTVSHHITKAEKYGTYSKLFPIGQKIKILYNQLFESQKPRFPRYGGWILDV